MPIAEHIRVTALGELGGTAGEKFSYGINLMNGGGGFPGLDPNMDAWQDMANDVAAFHARAASQIGNPAVLREVKVAHIVPGGTSGNGKYASDPLSFAYNVAGGRNILGPNGDTPTAPQTALAVSFTTNRRGPSGKGRMYLPLVGCWAVPSNGWRIAVAEAEGVRGSVVTLLNNLANQPGIDAVDLRPCVVSRKGFNTEIQGVRVGRLLDTVRSRRAQLSESYTSVAPTDFTLTD